MFVGFKGIKYVAMVSTYVPIIPVVALLALLACTIGGVFNFDPGIFHRDETTTVGLYSLAGKLGVLSVVCAYMIGFFATAGPAGCDFASNNRNRNDVILGGLVGIVGGMVITGVIALIAIAGAWGTEGVTLNPYGSMKAIMGSTMGGMFMFLLALAAFPSACIAAFIAANSFKTTLPKVNPLVSCGIGLAVSCVLIVSTVAGNAGVVFGFIGASFGPFCGALIADYILSGKKWAGPRAGFNPAGWISLAGGFLVGGLPLLPGIGGFFASVIPCPPVSAFIVGFILYYILAKAGMESEKLDMPQRIDLETDTEPQA